MISRLRALLHAQSGQSLVLSALAITALISFLGLAIDVGHLRYLRRTLQTTTDSAALAAGLEIRTCAGVYPCTAMSTAVSSSLTENGLTGTSIAFNCAKVTPTTSVTVTINVPPCALGSLDPNYGKSAYVEVQATQLATTWFGKVVGWNNIPLSARAEVTRAGTPCIYALDPTSAGSLFLAAGITVTCPIVVESVNRAAVACLLGIIAAPSVSVTGGTAGLLCAVTPPARTNAPPPVPADPLSYLTPPTTPARTACGTTVASPFHGSAGLLTILGTATLYPDKAYCGGIVIGPLAHVTFMPGTYVITSTTLLGLPALTPGLTISPLANVTGTGVTFYNYGPAGGIVVSTAGVTGVLGNISLSAPTSGAYSGILYYQDPGNTTLSTILLNTDTTAALQGGYYLPSASLNYAVSLSGPYSIIVAKDISFTATITFTSNYSSLANGSPVLADNVQLVQ